MYVQACKRGGAISQHREASCLKGTQCIYVGFPVTAWCHWALIILYRGEGIEETLGV